MAVGLTAVERIAAVPGVRVAAVPAGIRYRDRNDLVLFELREGSQTAAVFTQNAFRAAPVLVCESHLRQAQPRYWMINAGNANAGTGKAGMDACLYTCRALAQLTGVTPEEILPFSTGVIGEVLPVEPFDRALPSALDALQEDAWMSAARGVMTTDTLPKGVSERVELSGGSVLLSGIAKGSGMICPNMATMLSYVATDALVDAETLDRLLRQAVDLSFNAITVDGDTSTNDSCVLAATAASGVSLQNDEDLRLFSEALTRVLQSLAQSIVRDGEGATKFVTVSVEQAENPQEAKRVAYSVAHSPLVKTALFASDANWGRILCAVGYAGVKDLNVDNINIYLGDVQIVADGGRAPDYQEAQGSAVMAQEDIGIRIVLGRGEVATTVWTSDLSHEYVSINAEYRS